MSSKRTTLCLWAPGLLLLTAGQTLTQVHLRPLSDSWYALVWSGFILVADGFVYSRTGASLITRRPRDFGVMLGSSAAVWWLYEIANRWLFSSWTYSSSPDVPLWAQAMRSTLAFSTLVPATWQAALVVLSLSARRDAPRPSTGVTSRRLGWTVIGFGVALLGGALAWRSLALPLALVGLLLSVDASNALRRRPNLLRSVLERRLTVPLAFFFSSMVAGLVGEAWNYRADPRWTYDVRFPAGPRIFEMPLAGYLGYGFLALDVFAVYHAIRPRFVRPELDPAERHRSGPDMRRHPLTISGLD